MSHYVADLVDAVRRPNGAGPSWQPEHEDFVLEAHSVEDAQEGVDRELARRGGTWQCVFLSGPIDRDNVYLATGEFGVTARIDHEPANYLGLGAPEGWILSVWDSTAPELSDEWASSFTATKHLTLDSAERHAALALDADVSDLR